MRAVKKHLLIMLVIVASVLVLAAQQRPASPYNAAQATAGQTSYQANCATCHLASLAGQGDVPPLRGATFMQNWSRRTTQDLVSFLQLTMPPTRAGPLCSER